MDIITITGFLGSGKTTLLLTFARLLKAVGISAAVIENDAGAFPVDAVLVKQNGLQIKEISGGCICCSLQQDLSTAVSEIRETVSPEILLIEPSGAAGLQTVSQTLHAALKAGETLTSLHIIDYQRASAFSDVQSYLQCLPFLLRSISESDILVINVMNTAARSDSGFLQELINEVKLAAETKPVYPISAVDEISAAPLFSKIIENKYKKHPEYKNHQIQRQFQQGSTSWGDSWKRNEPQKVYLKQISGSREPAPSFMSSFLDTDSNANLLADPHTDIFENAHDSFTFGTVSVKGGWSGSVMKKEEQAGRHIDRIKDLIQDIGNQLSRRQQSEHDHPGLLMGLIKGVISSEEGDGAVWFNSISLHGENLVRGGKLATPCWNLEIVIHVIIFGIQGTELKPMVSKAWERSMAPEFQLNEICL